MTIEYVGMSDGNYFTLYHYLADGGRPVLEILIDPHNEIWIAAVTGISVPAPTGFKVHRHRDEELEAAGIDTEHICQGAITVVVELNIIDFMARVYVPASIKTKEHENG